MHISNEKHIQQLIKERDKLLKCHPELISYQLEIDNVLDQLENQSAQNRAHKLTQMLLSKVAKELLPANNELLKLRKRIKALEDAA